MYNQLFNVKLDLDKSTNSDLIAAYNLLVEYELDFLKGKKIIDLNKNHFKHFNPGEKKWLDCRQVRKPVFYTTCQLIMDLHWRLTTKLEMSLEGDEEVESYIKEGDAHCEAIKV